MRRFLGPLGAATVLFITPASGQYFGQNRVQYRTFDFSIIETEHFDVYAHEGLHSAANDAARMAERGYARLSRVLNHQYRERQPIILYESHSGFQQNNLTEISEGVQGVTDPLRHRVMLPFTGSYADFDHVLQHELVHQFQFDVFARGVIGAGLSQLIAVQPPLWFMEGMAEYLSVGPVDPLTAMWLRDAVEQDNLPTIHQLASDPRIFPYRFGHAVMSFIGETWGDDVIGEVLHAVASSGLEFGMQRALGIPLDELSARWHDAVHKRYAPELTDAMRPSDIAQPVLTRDRSKGGLHVSPALSPDGREIAYFSEGGSYFIDLYLADAETGRVKHRLVKSAFSSDFESVRFLNSGGAWSRDGRYFAFPAKRGGRDDIVIFDTRANEIHRRIPIELAGVTNPSWSPDGSRLVFTGLDGGSSDLFVIRSDGTHFERLTADRFADLHPVWSPDGKTIAFTTDRGAHTNLDELSPGKLSIAMFDVDTRQVHLLPQMEGRNIDPQWSPDGGALAFVSDRTGTSNIFLYELDERTVYQLTRVFTGVSGITPTSPAISWAASPDHLAFSYYEDGEYNVYLLRDPRRLKGAPFYTPPDPPAIAGTTPRWDSERPDAHRGNTGRWPFLPSELIGSDQELGDASPADARTSRPTLRPISVRALLDSANLSLPDTTRFGFRRYSPSLQIDYAIQPSIGYVRDNFGQGVFGGTAVSLSDMLGNRRAFFGLQLNGRIDEAQIAATYANLARRTNWAVGYEQSPFFYFASADLTTDPSSGDHVLNQRLQRLVVHRAFAEAHRPFNRFHRLEYRISAVNLSQAELNYRTRYDPASGFITDVDVEKTGTGGASYIQPAVAIVFDNSVPLWVGPFLGRRSRLEYAPAFGQWRFHQALADLRRYDRVVGPLTLASRVLILGRFGRDSEKFPIFLGVPELLRGYTSGSFRRRECAAVNGTGVVGGCRELNQLVGSRIALFNIELRYPFVHQLIDDLLPVPVFPLEAALFFDSGIAWEEGATLTVTRHEGDNKRGVREPLSSWGLSMRGNIFGFMILRGDYAKPLSRNGHRPYWTLSIGPTF